MYFRSRFVVSFCFLAFLSACSSPSVKKYEVVSTAIEQSNLQVDLSLDSPKPEIRRSGNVLVYKERYFSALGMECLKYKSTDAVHHFCYQEGSWEQYELNIVNMELNGG